MPIKIPMMLGSRFGRRQLKVRVHRASWPVIRRVAWLYRRTLLKPTGVIAVVGSFGKSTTTRAVAAALGPECCSKAIGNARSFIADALLRVPPGAPFAVIEVGIDGPGQMERLAHMVRPRIAVVTGVGCEHNRSMFSLGVTRYEKSRILSVLDTQGLAILNGDDPNVLWMRQRTKARVITCGFGAENDVRAIDFRCHGPEDASFSIVAGESIHRVETRLPSRQQARSLLAAFAVARYAAAVPVEMLVERLAGIEALPGRFQPIRLPSGVVLIRDEFKSPPESIHAALDALQEIPARRRVVVLGDISEPPMGMGRAYREIGRHLVRVADLAALVTHDFRRYASGARQVKEPECFIGLGAEIDRAIRVLKQKLRPGDVVLLKGRDTQKLDRIALALMGRTVECKLRFCRLSVRCERCPKLSCSL
ncbi:MAG: Mur ligase family protein [Acidobacteriota bacterium]